MKIPESPKDNELTELVEFDSMGHYPSRHIKLSKQELEYIQFLDNKSALYDELRDKEIGQWFYGILMKEERRTVRIPLLLI